MKKLGWIFLMATMTGCSAQVSNDLGDAEEGHENLHDQASATKAWVRVLSEGICGEYDPYQVGDACMYSVQILSGSRAGQTKTAYLADYGQFLKSGDLVVAKLTTLSGRFRGQFNLEPIAQNQYLRLGEQTDCGEIDQEEIGDACSYEPSTLYIANGSTAERTFYANASTYGYEWFRAGDLVDVAVREVEGYSDLEALSSNEINGRGELLRVGASTCGIRGIRGIRGEACRYEGSMIEGASFQFFVPASSPLRLRDGELVTLSLQEIVGRLNAYVASLPRL